MAPTLLFLRENLLMNPLTGLQVPLSTAESPNPSRLSGPECVSAQNLLSPSGRGPFTFWSTRQVLLRFEGAVRLQKPSTMYNSQVL
jgi:hypothetical protein